jgi:Domain of unknown function (DUF4148)
MNAKTLIGFSLIAFTSFGFIASASAQETTRAEVRQELIQAENNGSRFVTEASYPDVSPIYTQQVARLKQQHDSGTGAAMQGTTQSGYRPAQTGAAANRACVGPRSFCDVYAGS